MEATTDLLRQHAEAQFKEELSQLAAVDKRQKPPRWLLSPWAVLTYLMGGKLKATQPTHHDGGDAECSRFQALLQTDRPAYGIQPSPTLLIDTNMGETFPVRLIVGSQHEYGDEKQ